MLLPTATAVISTVVLIFNRNGMQASKHSWRSHQQFRTAQAEIAQPKAFTAEPFEKSFVMLNGFQPGVYKQLSIGLPAVSSMSFICWLHHTELGSLKRAAAFCCGVLRYAALRCAVLCCIVLCIIQSHSWAMLCYAERIARSCTTFLRWVHYIEPGPLERAAASAMLW